MKLWQRMRQSFEAQAKMEILAWNFLCIPRLAALALDWWACTIDRCSLLIPLQHLQRQTSHWAMEAAWAELKELEAELLLQEAGAAEEQED